MSPNFPFMLTHWNIFGIHHSTLKHSWYNIGTLHITMEELISAEMFTLRLPADD